MRVVSQHGNVDLPYEEIVVLHVDRSVMAIHNGKEYTLGVYSSMKKSYKAMEMLRENYMRYATARSDSYWFAFDNPKVFQFPKDEEIEVEDE